MITDKIPMLSVPIEGTWRNGVILFADRRLYRVAETGGTATAVETLSWKPGQRRQQKLHVPAQLAEREVGHCQWPGC